MVALSYHPVADLHALVKRRCSAPAWAVFEELREHPTNGLRRADVLAMSVYPSRGLVFHGFELKNSRGDWLRELKDVTKSVPIQRFCHAWWIVAQPGVVDKGELPDTWGLLVPDRSGSRLITQTKAPRLDPQTPTMEFVASVLRKAASARDRQLDLAYQRGRDAGRREGPDETSKIIKELERDLGQLKQSLEAFERISGIKIDEYSGEHLGKTVKLLRSHYYDSVDLLVQLRDDVTERNTRIVELLNEDIQIAKQRQAQRTDNPA